MWGVLVEERIARIGLYNPGSHLGLPYSHVSAKFFRQKASNRQQSVRATDSPAQEGKTRGHYLNGVASRKGELPNGFHLWTLIIGLQKNIGKWLSGKTMTIGSKEDNDQLLRLLKASAEISQVAFRKDYDTSTVIGSRMTMISSFQKVAVVWTLSRRPNIEFFPDMELTGGFQ